MAEARELKRILVTGGAGFIGSHICHRLLDEGCWVVAYDNLLTGSMENIAPLLGHARFEFQHYDVTNFLFVEGDERHATKDDREAFDSDPNGI